VKEYPAYARAVVLSVRPGITDLASIEYRDEGFLLDNAGDPERIYREQILPIKVGYYTKYVQESNLGLDLRLILKTFEAVYCRQPITPDKTNAKKTMNSLRKTNILRFPGKALYRTVSGRNKERAGVAGGNPGQCL
jgi:lipopolysaccharide/colanic/teichoic acid biosynthesis glycosyltransferase